MHRDYQGSILAITDAAGAVLEKRLFDAWGAIVKVQDGAGNNLNVLTILDRGYTGHEHLQSVGLINMNGRLYDPKLHRFLQPDNYVQDPSNTQNYNRYGYVLNNPLKYTDPSGEKCDCPNRSEGLSDTEQQGLGALIASLLQSSWVSRNFSARNFDEAGTAVGKAFRDATNWVTSGIAGLFGNYRSAPVTQVMSNADMNAYKANTEANRYFDTGRMIGITGLGVDAGAYKMFNSDNWFSIKQFKTYGQDFNGSGYAGGKIASALKVSNNFKFAGKFIGLGGNFVDAANTWNDIGKYNTIDSNGNREMSGGRLSYHIGSTAGGYLATAMAGSALGSEVPVAGNIAGFVFGSFAWMGEVSYDTWINTIWPQFVQFDNALNSGWRPSR